MIKKVLIIFILLHFNLMIGQSAEVDMVISKTNAQIEKIDKLEDWDNVLNYKIENYTLDNATVRAYYKNKKIVKLVFEAFNLKTRQVNRYYFNDDILIYALMLETKSNSADDATLELKNYFVKNNLVYQTDNTATNSFTSKDFLKAVGASILDEVIALRSLLEPKASVAN